jgi:hypothetical protein
MKKLNILFGLLLIASFTFAQTAVVTQDNVPGSGTVIANVTQTGTNTAAVTQYNVESTTSALNATITQTSPGAANIATIEQTADYAPATNGVILNATSTQNGESNTSTQIQTADAASRVEMEVRTFIADQDGISNTINQTSTDGDQGSVTFDAKQTGDRNMATQLTNRDGGSFPGDMATGIIIQLKDDNTATQTMQSLNADGYIKQDGLFNNATQFFGDYTRWNDFDIEQIGDNNIAEQEAVTGANRNSEFFIMQDGTDNQAYQKVDGINAWGKIEQVGYNNYANQMFHGTNNLSHAVQNGDNGTIYMEQWGMDNIARVEQDGDGSTAYIDQDGIGNIVQGLIGGDFAINGNGSTLDVDQIGDHNIANVEQTFLGASATITQNGDNNDATVIQQ